MAQRNAAKVHAKWRDLLRQAKLVELQKEVQRITQAHEAAVLAKSKLTEVRPAATCILVNGSHLSQDLHAVQELIGEVAEAERMHEHAAQEHISVVAGLLELQGDRMQRILHEFQDSLQASEQFGMPLLAASAHHHKSAKSSHRRCEPAETANLLCRTWQAATTTPSRQRQMCRQAISRHSAPYMQPWRPSLPRCRCGPTLVCCAASQ